MKTFWKSIWDENSFSFNENSVLTLLGQIIQISVFAWINMSVQWQCMSYNNLSKLIKLLKRHNVKAAYSFNFDKIWMSQQEHINLNHIGCDRSSGWSLKHYSALFIRGSSSKIDIVWQSNVKQISIMQAITTTIHNPSITCARINNEINR